MVLASDKCCGGGQETVERADACIQLTSSQNHVEENSLSIQYRRDCRAPHICTSQYLKQTSIDNNAKLRKDQKKKKACEKGQPSLGQRTQDKRGE